ncbi:Oidioi.mRNA.OKI2018_I69.PAR.g11670.t1.cds [Oikopleura dioica]|uniref:Oidioi.mRNA.OKI2018_I69.PAR.g11670.t1.cds n=1 Tax=Oikopleura dioica TaxID=34765 RepID=A0ABN7RWT4_OIKDI|nr:Oidioi.mRNA.OKI2018_I69.PAR.g11670.t1.cds [Oikopleura dioica]
MKNIEIVTPWLEVEDYPKLLGSATLGVSLHTSSSGCDLPMKVVDMFGAGCPAFALNFQAITELVKDGENGKIFNSSDELAELIREHLVKSSRIDEYRSNLAKERISWEDHWSSVAAAHFSSCTSE